MSTQQIDRDIEGTCDQFILPSYLLLAHQLAPRRTQGIRNTLTNASPTPPRTRIPIMDQGKHSSEGLAHDK